MRVRAWSVLRNFLWWGDWEHSHSSQRNFIQSSCVPLPSQWRSFLKSAAWQVFEVGPYWAWRVVVVIATEDYRHRRSSPQKTTRPIPVQVEVPECCLQSAGFAERVRGLWTQFFQPPSPLNWWTTSGLHYAAVQIQKPSFSRVFLSIPLGQKTLHTSKKVGGNLFDVTQCNTLHHSNCQEFLWCNVCWCCSFGVVMVPLGLTHIHDARIRDVLFCLCIDGLTHLSNQTKPWRWWARQFFLNMAATDVNCWFELLGLWGNLHEVPGINTPNEPPKTNKCMIFRDKFHKRMTRVWCSLMRMLVKEHFCQVCWVSNHVLVWRCLCQYQKFAISRIRKDGMIKNMNIPISHMFIGENGMVCW